LLSMSVLGAFGAEFLAPAVLKAALAVMACCCLVAGTGFLSEPTARSESPLYLTYAAVCSLSLAALHFAERRLAQVAAAAGGLALAARVLTDCVAAEDCARLAEAPPAEHLVLLVLGAALQAYTARVAAAVLRAARADQARYDAAWRRLLDAGAASDLSLLADAAAAAAAACPERPVLHVRAAPSRLVLSAPSWTGATEAPGGFGPREVSLHEAYVQAAALVSLLAQRCEAWAAAAGGGCKTWQCGPSWGQGDEVLAEALGDGAGEWARRGWLKRHARAVEKREWRYGGDAARVVDLCRGRVECRAVADVVACLAAATADRGVEVVRVRNTMAADGGSPDHCAGLRVRSHPPPASPQPPSPCPGLFSFETPSPPLPRLVSCHFTSPRRLLVAGSVMRLQRSDADRVLKKT
jgi:hypothetical protein